MKPELRRRIGLGAGVVFGVCAVLGLETTGCETLRAPGPMNTAHDGLACSACHRAAPGTVRQQLQAAALAWVAASAGDDVPAADIGYRAVTNTECVACHDRPDDRHPVFRFLEPRFAAVRDRLHPEQCTSCHREHAGVRITIADGTYCRHCHAELALERDPLDVPHRALVDTGRWDTCLGCHDYHGNHEQAVPERLDDRIPPAHIDRYFDGGPSPYGPPIRRALQRPVEVTSL